MRWICCSVYFFRKCFFVVFVDFFNVEKSFEIGFFIGKHDGVAFADFIFFCTIKKDWDCPRGVIAEAFVMDDIV